MYAGPTYDGLRHLVVNGLLLYGVFRLIDDGEAWGAYLVGGIAVPFYMGNVYGAARAAREFNSLQRSEFLARELGQLEPPQ